VAPSFFWRAKLTFKGAWDGLVSVRELCEVAPGAGIGKFLTPGGSLMLATWVWWMPVHLNQ
jgi:hypothetical protein